MPRFGYGRHRSEGGLHARDGLCGSCTCVRVAGVVGLLGSARRVGFVVVRCYPLVVVFVGVRFDMGVQRKNALLSGIYVLALSEPPMQRVSSEKDAQSCPETSISTLVRGREFRLLRIKRIQHLRRLCMKARSKLRGYFR